MENQQNQSKSTQNQSKSTLLHALRTVGDGVANNLNDASHLPHLAEYLLIHIVHVVNSQRDYPRRNYTFTSSIRWAPSRPGIVRTRKRAESGEMCEI